MFNIKTLKLLSLDQDVSRPAVTNIRCPWTPWLEFGREEGGRGGEWREEG